MEPKHYRMSLEEKKRVKDILKRALAVREEVVFAFIYGSFIDDRNLPFRDVDIGVYSEGMEEKESVWYSIDLADQLSSLAKIPVDARVLNFAPATFLYHVIRGELLVDKDDDKRSAFMEQVIRKYLDMKPLLRRAFREAFAS